MNFLSEFKFAHDSDSIILLTNTLSNSLLGNFGLVPVVDEKESKVTKITNLECYS